MSHKGSKERTEKLLTSKLIKFQFTLVKFKYLKKMLQTILKFHCLKLAILTKSKQKRKKMSLIVM